MKFHTLIRTGLLTSVLSTAAFATFAQDRVNTILVLDGSGSMWGQIDGVNKITIAQQVVGDVLDGFPEDQNLGLTVYGHREKGNCSDIETVVAPATGTQDAIRAAVNGIKPKGKTPMTDAVIAAAKALRYTEEKATVILVSDGIETCNPDPCAAAAALEDAGVDFTAHVIGFDVTDPKALAQMQCMAQGTGGTFLKASDAAELSQALTQVAAAPEPDPQPVSVTFEARLDAENGPLVEGPVLWSLTPAPDTMPPDTEGNALSVQMEQGSYDLTAYWAAAETEAKAQFAVGDGPRTVVVVFETPAQTATVTAPATAIAGSTIEVDWNGPNEQDDYIGIGAEAAERAARWQNYAYTRDGSPVQLLVPPQPGRYAIQYFLGRDQSAIGSTLIDVTEPQIALTAPATAAGGSRIEIGWTGPGYDDDFIGIGKADAQGAARWEVYDYPRNGNPLTINVPVAPGAYQITYFAGQDQTALVSVPLTVTELAFGVQAPGTAPAGSTIQVQWTGPGYEDDYVGVGPAGAEGAQLWQSYSYTRDGNPVPLILPTTPGDYVVTYFTGQDTSPQASTPITLTPITASLTAPASADAGGMVLVDWTGPNYDGDYIGIGPSDATGGPRWETYEYTETGSPLQVPVPDTAGSYTIRYFLGQDQTPLAETRIEVK